MILKIIPQLPTNNDKIRYLRYVENVVRDFTNSWRRHKIAPALAPCFLIILLK